LLGLKEEENPMKKNPTAQSKKMTLAARLEWEADNRRKLLAQLQPAIRKMAEQEFAKLGLFQ
jgi:hypothetical protein